MIGKLLPLFVPYDVGRYLLENNNAAKWKINENNRSSVSMGHGFHSYVKQPEGNENLMNMMEYDGHILRFFFFKYIYIYIHNEIVLNMSKPL